jgi:hypothetical protein
MVLEERMILYVRSLPWSDGFRDITNSQETG